MRIADYARITDLADPLKNNTKVVCKCGALDWQAKSVLVAIMPPTRVVGVFNFELRIY